MQLTLNRLSVPTAIALTGLILCCSVRLASAQGSHPDSSSIAELSNDSLPEAPLPSFEPNHTAAQSPFESELLQQQTQSTEQFPSNTAKPAAPDTNSPNPADQGEQKKKNCGLLPCAEPIVDWYKRFADGPQVKPLTPTEKAWLATRNLIDPFNLGTILVEGGISVAANPHSAYGPGFPGYGRYVGVSFTQDLTGEFFGTFLIPSIVHQDPHYHRMPKATIFRRSLHVVYQVVWTQGDNGKGMLNYANLAGFAIEDEIGNLYVPGQRTNASATAQRYAVGLATAPIDNVITEFLPDVARRIHVQVVVVQRIINHIANNNANGS